MGDSDKSLDYTTRSLDIAHELNDKYGEAGALHTLGLVYLAKGDLDKGIGFFERSLTMQKEIGVGANDLVGTTAYLFLSYKRIGKKYEQDELFKLIEQSDKLEFEINFCIYQLLEDKIYLETAHTQIQEIANNLESGTINKFLSYPVPIAIIEEWEKVKNSTSF